MEYINLTPHKIKEVVTGLEIEPSGEIARVSVQYEPAGEAGGVPLFAAKYGEVDGIPAPQLGVIYIVSGMVKSHPAVAGRDDVVAPGDLVRDENGQPIGCRGFKVRV